MAVRLSALGAGYSLHPRKISGTARVFSRDSPWKVAQWTGRPIRESWGVLWLVIRLLSVRADVSSSVRSILPCTERLYCIPLHTCQHAGALPATTNTSPAPRRRTARTKYYYGTRNLPRGLKGGRHIRLTTLPPSVSRLSRESMRASTSHNPTGLHGLLQG
jgi:hypothetical protein